MTRDQRQQLRSAALAAMNGVHTRSASATRSRILDTPIAILAADWKLQTSNSFRRIGAHGDGDVLCGTKHPIDAHPDLLAAPGVLDYVVAAQPRVVIQLLDDVDALEDKLDQARVISRTISIVDARLDKIAFVFAGLATVIENLARSTDSVTIAEARVVIAKLAAMVDVVPR